MEHSRVANRPIGSPVERLEDLRFLRGRGQYRRRRAERRMRCMRWSCAARSRTAASVGSMRRRRASVPAFARSSRRRMCWRTGRHSHHHHAAGAAAGVRALPAAGDRPATRCATSASRSRSWWPTARRWPRTRSMRSCSTSSRCRRWRPRSDARRNASLLFEATGRNHVITLSAVKGDADAAFKDAPYVAARALSGAALHRGDDGAARAARRMGRREAASHRVRHDQGGVPQPAHPRQADGPRRGRHHHDRGRRRRRLRRARRVLSRRIS